MKNRFLKWYLRTVARQLIRRYTPIVIGVTGSVGKTTAREAIYAVLSRRFVVSKNINNFNNEFGVPLTIMGVMPLNGDEHYFEKFLFFIKLLHAGIKAWWPASQTFPKIMVLELGADRPGDIVYLAKIVQPTIGVVTAIGDVPVHVEYYASPAAVIVEKSQLIHALPAAGLAVLNYDDKTVLDMSAGSKAPVRTFGFSNSADVWISDIALFAAAGKRLGGLSFKLHQKHDNFVPVRINDFIGTHQLYGVMAGACVGLHFAMNLVEISQALEHAKSPRGRMNLLTGIKHTTIIDDTYNSSPVAALAALDALRDYATSAAQLLGRVGRRIAILGDMKELGRYEAEAHRTLGIRAAERADVVIAVGNAGIFTAEAARTLLSPNAVLHFQTADEARLKIQDILQQADVILVKGSQSMRMEKIVKEIMADPDRAPELLVRQYGKWLDS